MRRRRLHPVTFLPLLLAGCLFAPPSVGSPRQRATALPDAVQAISFLGDTLRAWPLPDDVRARFERELAAAELALSHAPTNPDSIVWVGRRLAYLGRVREAIDVYSRGIRLHPANPWLYRHRGHRWITLRKLDEAIADLEQARRLVRGTVDVVEPDGLPNAQGIPIGTLHSNIDYHLALAYYLRGDFERAIPIYRRELAAAHNDDRLVSAAHWLYMALRRSGRQREAQRVLLAIGPRVQVIENDTYLQLLRLYRGELRADSLLSPDATDSSGAMSVVDATAAYGVGNWHLYNGRSGEAERIFRRILAGGQWGAFGYIAAEAELARSR